MQLHYCMYNHVYNHISIYLYLSIYIYTNQHLGTPLPSGDGGLDALVPAARDGAAGRSHLGAAVDVGHVQRNGVAQAVLRRCQE